MQVNLVTGRRPSETLVCRVLFDRTLLTTAALSIPVAFDLACPVCFESFVVRE